jgi:putative holliday junction resolvase
MARWIGIDYGDRRIGVATADPGERIASPATTLNATGSVSGDARSVLKWAADHEAEAIVVGLPLSMDGSDSAQTRHVRNFADALRAAGTLRVELWDERLTTFQADELLESSEIPAARRKGLRDRLAAQMILQSFLDARRPQ